MTQINDVFFNNKSKDSPRIYGIEYMLQDVDDSAFPHFYGFMSYNGSYYIMKEFATGSVSYSKKEFGSRGSYSQAWQGRASQAYSTWDSTF
jgi:hypothetical protein